MRKAQLLNRYVSLDCVLLSAFTQYIPYTHHGEPIVALFLIQPGLQSVPCLIVGVRLLNPSAALLST